ncbi:MAG: ribosome silencing factor [Candidatus Omnitrophota bacterium]
MKKRALKIVELAQAVKAIEPVILDLRKVSNFCDFFVIITGTSQTHIRAIADNIETGLKKQSLTSRHKEGYKYTHWVVLDYNSVIVHIFNDETRKFYDLEHLWADAPIVEINQKG